MNYYDPDGKNPCLISPAAAIACAVVGVATLISAKKCSDGISELAEQAAEDSNAFVECFSNPACSRSPGEFLADMREKDRQALEKAHNGARGIAESFPGTTNTGPVPTSKMDALLRSTTTVTSEVIE